MPKLNERQERQLQYLIKVLSAIQEGCFEEDSENYIDKNDFKNPEALTDFIHVMANGVPSKIYSEITGDEKNHLDFNHLANKLVFKNSNLIEDESE